MFVNSRSSGAGRALLLVLWAPWAMAQDAETVTRVQRDAANPLRMIIEAGKLKVRQKSPEADPEPAAKPVAPARAAAAKPPAVVSPVLATAALAGRTAANPVPEPLLAAPVAIAPVADPAPALPPAPPTTAALASESGSDAQATVAQPADPAPAGVAAPDIANESAGSAAGTIADQPPQQLALAALAPPAATPIATASQRVKLDLTDYVEPVISERVRRRLKGNGEVMIEFTVQADGSVVDPAVRSASDKALEEAALDAVRQWRYRPIPAAQPHAAQLVFRFKD
jgi:TonB family protein